MKMKFEVGDKVLVKRATFSPKENFFATVVQPLNSPCPLCPHESGCKEYDVQGEDGNRYYHIPACQMELLKEEAP